MGHLKPKILYSYPGKPEEMTMYISQSKFIKAVTILDLQRIL